jgi:hypothetical protein
LARRLLQAHASAIKNKEEQDMSIEKKSLISNRAVTKKAIVTKPGVTKVASPKASAATRVVHSAVRGVNSKIGVPNTRISNVKIASTLVSTKVKAL